MKNNVKNGHLFVDLLRSSQSKRRGYNTDVKVELENLPTGPVTVGEFDKYAERLDLAVGRETIDRLYQALTLGKKAGYG